MSDYLLKLLFYNWKPALILVIYICIKFLSLHISISEDIDMIKYCSFSVHYGFYAIYADGNILFDILFIDRAFHTKNTFFTKAYNMYYIHLVAIYVTIFPNTLFTSTCLITGSFIFFPNWYHIIGGKRFLHWKCVW